MGDIAFNEQNYMVKKSKANNHGKYLLKSCEFKLKTNYICYVLSVLKAINQDSPTVPALLTDYILKGRSSVEMVYCFACVAWQALSDFFFAWRLSVTHFCHIFK